MEISSQSADLIRWSCVDGVLDDTVLAGDSVFEREAAGESPVRRRGQISWIYADFLYIAGGYRFDSANGAQNEPASLPS